jgi:hypothetical protein
LLPHGIFAEYHSSDDLTAVNVVLNAFYRVFGKKPVYIPASAAFFWDLKSSDAFSVYSVTE